MCGIAGVVSSDNNLVSNVLLKSMTDAIAHRGPDGEGHWIDEMGCVGLGHRRLSILDLSIAGSQPMHYLDRYSIVFNGEIYNYLEIKSELKQRGYQFRSDSDTEVLLAHYDFKKERCLDDLDGMFAFAIWDNQEQILFCARDRFGEKPFYYHQSKKGFSFCSEMKGLWAIAVPKETNERMLFNYWYFDSIYNPNNLSETFYENIFSLEPSTFIVVDNKGKIVKKQKYWNIDYTQQENLLSFDKAKEKFYELLYVSIQRRLRSDVPVGSSLSGGLDSSSIVGMIDQIKAKGTKQKTFSARFPGFIKDESKYIDLMLNNVNAESFSCFPNSESFNGNLDKIIYHQEEPFGSLSIAAQYEVMELAKQHDTIVLLDGQGADEYLCGYHGLIDSFFGELKRTDKNKYIKQLSTYKKVHSSNHINSISRRLRNGCIKEILSNKQIDLLLGIRAGFNYYTRRDAAKDLYSKYHKEQFSKKYKADTLNEMLYYATFCGGLQELLRYADRNSMAHSREVRLPFLSHELVTFVFSLPSSFKVNNGFSKSILRDTMTNLLPNDIVWRKDKIGYEPPKMNEFQLKQTLVNKNGFLK